LALLRVGFAVRPLSPAARCALTAPFHPCLCPRGPSAVCSLLHFPSSLDARALPGTLPCGARTFLRRVKTDSPAIPTRTLSTDAKSGRQAGFPWVRRDEKGSVGAPPSKGNHGSQAGGTEARGRGSSHPCCAPVPMGPVRPAARPDHGGPGIPGDLSRSNPRDPILS